MSEQFELIDAIPEPDRFLTHCQLIDELQEPDRYLAHCLRTWYKKDEEATPNDEFFNAFSGVIGELGEFIVEHEFIRRDVYITSKVASTERFLKEAGDVCYYITILRFLTGLNTAFFLEAPGRKEVSIESQQLNVLLEMTTLAESIKKFIFQDNEEVLPFIEESLQSAVNYIMISTQKWDFQEHVLDANVLKLQKRWPDR